MSRIIKLKGTGSIAADREVINRNFECLVKDIIDIQSITSSGEINTTSDAVANTSQVPGETVTQALNELLNSITDNNSLTIVDEYGDLPATPNQNDLAYVRNISGTSKIIPALYVYDTAWELISRKDSVEYITDLNDSVVSPGIEIPSGTTVADLKGITFSKFIDDYVFPTVFPQISSNQSINLIANVSPNIVEVGTLLNPTLSATFTQGQIQNGDGSVGPELVGLPNTYVFTGKGIPSNVTISSSNLNETITTAESGFNTSNADFGNNTWDVNVSYDAGSGNYFDSKGNISTLLDNSRIAGSISDTSNIIIGRYKYFYDTGVSIPTDSSGVRSASNEGFLNSSNKANFDIEIQANTVEVWFSVFGNLTISDISVLYVESSNADVTGTFNANVFNVNDANGNPITYTTFSTSIPGGGYPVLATYAVNIN